MLPFLSIKHHHKHVSRHGVNTTLTDFIDSKILIFTNKVPTLGKGSREKLKITLNPTLCHKKPNVSCLAYHLKKIE